MTARIASASIGVALITLFLLLPAESPTISASPDQWVGNVDGTVRDADTLQPIGYADVYLLEPPVQQGGTGDLLHTDRGDVVLPDLRRAAKHTTTNPAGEFLINSVPVPFPSKAYTIVIGASGYGFLIIEGAAVLPGAVMSLNVDGKLKREVHSLFEPGDRSAPLQYRHEMEPSSPIPRSQPDAPSARADTVGYTILATREGLVGHTTANGHVILSHDHFVALPSFRALNANDQTYDFKVRVTYGGKTVEAPVWDVGPWNTADDYWNPSSVRQMWADLPQGMPEAQAAKQTGYNGGRDQYGRTVTLATAIDLADGTFWDDLGMLDNAWVSVKYLWKPDVVVGDRVRATADLAVRAAPGGNPVAVASRGAAGNIQSGPVGASLSQVYYVWWEILWDNGVRGWSAENQLEKALAAPTGYYLPIIGR